MTLPGRISNQRAFAAMTAFAVWLILIVAVLLVTPSKLSNREINTTEACIAGLAAMLVASAALVLWRAGADVLTLRVAHRYDRVVGDGEWLLATRAFDTALFNFFAKSSIAAATAVLPIARWSPGARTWLLAHPLLLLALLLGAMFLFTFVDITAIPYWQAMKGAEVPASTQERVSRIEREHRELLQRLRIVEATVAETLLPAADPLAFPEVLVDEPKE